LHPVEVSPLTDEETDRRVGTGSRGPIVNLGRSIDRHAEALMLAPSVVLVALLIVVPTAYLVFVSMSRLEITNAGAPEFIGLDNYVRLLTDQPEFWASLGRSVFFVFVAVPLEFLLGLGLALLMNEKLRGIQIIRTVMVMPLAMTPVVVGLVWLILYNPTFGQINYLLSLVGVEGPEWLSNPTLALPAVIAVDVWQWTPFVFLVLSAALLTVPKEVIDASHVDGASGWSEFRNISFPYIRRTAFVVVLLLFIDSWKAFDAIYALTKGGPGTATQTLNFFAYLQGFQWFHLGLAAAVIVLGVLASGIFSDLFLRVEPSLLEED
jgi:multiple sugar transport system permease protein